MNTSMLLGSEKEVVVTEKYDWVALKRAGEMCVIELMHVHHGFFEQVEYPLA